MEFEFRIRGHCALEAYQTIEADSIEEAERLCSPEQALMEAGSLVWPTVDSVELVGGRINHGDK